MKYLLLLGILPLIAFGQEANLFEYFKPKLCRRSFSPLFQASKVLEFEIRANFKDEILPFQKKSRTTAVISRQLENGKVELTLGELRSRGKSRLENCLQMKPLKMVFLDQKVVKATDFEAEVLAFYRKGEKLYEDALWSENSSDLFLEGRSVDGIFDKLGDDIKIVSHCGAKDSFYYTSSDETKDILVLKEYLAYRFLDFFETVNMKARLAILNYRQPDGELIDRRYAFYREPISQVAKRCYLNKRKEDPLNVQNIEQVFTQQAFLQNGDYHFGGHNIAYLEDKFKRTYFLPYDYDLSRFVIRVAKTENNNKFYRALKRWGKDYKAIARGFNFYYHIEQMRKDKMSEILSIPAHETLQSFLLAAQKGTLRYLSEMKIRSLSSYTRIERDYKRFLEKQGN